MSTAFVLNQERQARLDERLIAIDKIAAALQADREALTTAELADRLELPFDLAQRAICDLVIAGRIARADTRDGRPAYQLATVGRCEWCGLVDHHLIAGECPQCRNRIEAGRQANG